MLPAEGPRLVKKHGFRSLKLVNVDMDGVLGEEPFGVEFGRLENGLSYYVRSNSKSRMRAALALAVKAGYNVYFPTEDYLKEFSFEFLLLNSFSPV